MGYVDCEWVLWLIDLCDGMSLLFGIWVDDVLVCCWIFDVVDVVDDVCLSGLMQLLLGGSGVLIVLFVDDGFGCVGYLVGVVEYGWFFLVLLVVQSVVGMLCVDEDGCMIYVCGVNIFVMLMFVLLLVMYGQMWQLMLGCLNGLLFVVYVLLILLFGFVFGGVLVVVLCLLVLVWQCVCLVEVVSGELCDQIEVCEVVQVVLVDVEWDMIVVLESISDGVFMVDCEWCFIYVNLQVVCMFGVQVLILLDVLCWNVLFEVFDDGGWEGYLCIFWKWVLCDGMLFNIEVVYGLSQCWYELCVYLYIYGFIVYLYDVFVCKWQECELFKCDVELCYVLQLGCMGSWELYLCSGCLYWLLEICVIFGVDCSLEEEGLQVFCCFVYLDDWLVLMED